jgi:citrate/tricarballylate utilization protein
MLPAELVDRGAHMMGVCNSCRYCEAYCPAFQAMEERLVFKPADLAYLANLCHNCGECLYACQYAPPHEFGINVPRTFAELRLASYEDLCWPRALGVGFRRYGVTTAVLLVVSLSILMIAGSGNGTLMTPGLGGDFYRVLPHDLMVGLFGVVFTLAIAALTVAVVRFWRQMQKPAGVTGHALLLAIRDAATLRHLHSGDPNIDCTDAEDTRAPWRRRWHHATMYGFLLSFASTSVAAAYQGLFGWLPPYGLTSLPVVLGTIGGIGLIVGPAGLLALKRHRDEALNDPEQRGLDTAFTVLLLVTSVTGLVLLALREQAFMGLLLIVHLACVLTLFVTLPYGKFVHGIFRSAALLMFRVEMAHRESRPADVDSH